MKTRQESNKQNIFTRSICFSLSAVFFITNVVGAQAPKQTPKSNDDFWSERQKAVKAAKEYAQLPGGGALSSFRAGQFAMPQGPASSPLKQNILPDITGIEAKAKQQSAANMPVSIVKNGPGWLRSLPYNCGTLEEFYVSPKKGSTVVVFVQDVHGHYEAQLNIANIIQNITETQATEDRSPRTEVRNLKTDGRHRSSVIGPRSSVVIGLEGAVGAFDFSPYRAFPNKEINKEIADYFLKSGLISGPEYIGLVSDTEPMFWGVEDKDTYLANIEAFKESLPLRDNAKKQIETATRQVVDSKRKIYSPGMLALDDKIETYRNGTLGLGEYLEYLSQESEVRNQKSEPNIRLFLETFKLEKTINFQKVEDERRILIEKLVNVLGKEELENLVYQAIAHRMGNIDNSAYYHELESICQKHGLKLSNWPELARYVRYSIGADKIDRRALYKGINELENQVVAYVIGNDTVAKALYETSKNLSLVSKLIDNNLTDEEWNTYLSNKEKIHKTLEIPFETFEKFYETATSRNHILVENLLAKTRSQEIENRATTVKEELDSRLGLPPSVLIGGHSGMTNLNSSTVAQEHSSTAVLVAGGFHTQSMSKLLKEKQISYAVLSPKLTEIDKDSHYLEVFTQKPTQLDKLMLGEKIFLSAFRSVGSVTELAGVSRLPVLTRLFVALIAVRSMIGLNISEAWQVTKQLNEFVKTHSLPHIKAVKLSKPVELANGGYHLPMWFTENSGTEHGFAIEIGPLAWKTRMLNVSGMVQGELANHSFRIKGLSWRDRLNSGVSTVKTSFMQTMDNLPQATDILLRGPLSTKKIIPVIYKTMMLFVAVTASWVLLNLFPGSALAVVELAKELPGQSWNLGSLGANILGIVGTVLAAATVLTHSRTVLLKKPALRDEDFVDVPKKDYTTTAPSFEQAFRYWYEERNELFVGGPADWSYMREGASDALEKGDYERAYLYKVREAAHGIKAAVLNNPNIEDLDELVAIFGNAAKYMEEVVYQLYKEREANIGNSGYMELTSSISKLSNVVDTVLILSKNTKHVVRIMARKYDEAATYQFKSKLEKLGNMLDQSEKQYQKVFDNYYEKRGQFDKAREWRDNMQAGLKTLESRIPLLSQELGNVEKRLQFLHNRFSEYKNMSQKYKDELRDRIKAADESRSNLQRELSNSEKSYELTKKSLETAEAKLKTAESELNVAQKAVEALIKKIGAIERSKRIVASMARSLGKGTLIFLVAFVSLIAVEAFLLPGLPHAGQMLVGTGIPREMLEYTFYGVLSAGATAAIYLAKGIEPRRDSTWAQLRNRLMETREKGWGEFEKALYGVDLSGRVLSQPARIAINVDSFIANGEGLREIWTTNRIFDGIIRNLAGNPNISLATIYLGDTGNRFSIAKTRLIKFLEANEAHDRSFFNLKRDGDDIILNGVRIQIKQGLASPQDLALNNINFLIHAAYPEYLELYDELATAESKQEREQVLNAVNMARQEYEDKIAAQLKEMPEKVRVLVVSSDEDIAEDIIPFSSDSDASKSSRVSRRVDTAQILAYADKDVFVLPTPETYAAQLIHASIAQNAGETVKVAPLNAQAERASRSGSDFRRNIGLKGFEDLDKLSPEGGNFSGSVYDSRPKVGASFLTYRLRITLPNDSNEIINADKVNTWFTKINSDGRRFKGLIVTQAKDTSSKHEAFERYGDVVLPVTTVTKSNIPGENSYDVVVTAFYNEIGFAKTAITDLITELSMFDGNIAAAHERHSIKFPEGTMPKTHNPRDGQIYKKVTDDGEEIKVLLNGFGRMGLNENWQLWWDPNFKIAAVNGARQDALNVIERILENDDVFLDAPYRANHEGENKIRLTDREERITLVDNTNTAYTEIERRKYTVIDAIHGRVGMWSNNGRIESIVLNGEEAELGEVVDNLNHTSTIEAKLREGTVIRITFDNFTHKPLKVGVKKSILLKTYNERIESDEYKQKSGESDERFAERIRKYNSKKSERLMARIPEMGSIDIVVEGTGDLKANMLQPFLMAGAKSVVISNPDTTADAIIIPGANFGVILPAWKIAHILSCASCTTNAAVTGGVPILDILRILGGYMNTLHPYTNTQAGLFSKPQLGSGKRGAVGAFPGHLVMYLTTTGAASELSRALPEYEGIKAVAVRDATGKVSGINYFLTVTSKEGQKLPTAEEINGHVKKAVETNMKGYLGYKETVSSSLEMTQSPQGGVFIGSETKIRNVRTTSDGGEIGELEIAIGYDNEWGYVSQLIKLVMLLALHDREEQNVPGIMAENVVPSAGNYPGKVNVTGMVNVKDAKKAGARSVLIAPGAYRKMHAQANSKRIPVDMVDVDRVANQALNEAFNEGIDTPIVSLSPALKDEDVEDLDSESLDEEIKAALKTQIQQVLNGGDAVYPKETKGNVIPVELIPRIVFAFEPGATILNKIGVDGVQQYHEYIRNIVGKVVEARYKPDHLGRDLGSVVAGRIRVAFKGRPELPMIKKLITKADVDGVILDPNSDDMLGLVEEVVKLFNTASNSDPSRMEAFQRYGRRMFLGGILNPDSIDETTLANKYINRLQTRSQHKFQIELGTGLGRSRDLSAMLRGNTVPQRESRAEDVPVKVMVQNVVDTSDKAFMKRVRRQFGNLPEGFIDINEVSKLGGHDVLIAHSEVVDMLGLNDKEISNLVKRAHALKATGKITGSVVVGVSWSKVDEPSGTEFDILGKQVARRLEGLSAEQLAETVIAIEPQGAIGTGQALSPEKIESAAKQVRNRIRAMYPQAADSVRIIYGGSLDESNAETILALEDIDGALIGGASQKVDRFKQIVEIAAKIANQKAKPGHPYRKIYIGGNHKGVALAESYEEFDEAIAALDRENVEKGLPSLREILEISLGPTMSRITELADVYSRDYTQGIVFVDNLDDVFYNDEFKNKVFLIRADFNVPIDEAASDPSRPSNWKIAGDLRIRETIATIDYIRKRGGIVAVMTHFEPKQKKIQGAVSIEPIIKPRLAEHLGLKSEDIPFIREIARKTDSGWAVSDSAKSMLAEAKSGSVLLLENLRLGDYGKAEKAKDKATRDSFMNAVFGAFPAGRTVFANDAFGLAHRDDASNTSRFKGMPRIAGLLMKKELQLLNKLFKRASNKPVAVIVGGAKIEDKVRPLKNMLYNGTLRKGDNIFVYGGAALPFFAAQGEVQAGKSQALITDTAVKYAAEILELAAKKRVNIALPYEGLVVASELPSNPENKVHKETVKGDIGRRVAPSVPQDKYYYDIAPEVIKSLRYEVFNLDAEGDIVNAKYEKIIMAGPPGVFEYEEFSEGTRGIFEVLAQAANRGVQVILGGGDTGNAAETIEVEQGKKLADMIAPDKRGNLDISTGGGALLEALEGKVLPGIKGIRNQEDSLAYHRKDRNVKKRFHRTIEKVNDYAASQADDWLKLAALHRGSMTALLLYAVGMPWGFALGLAGVVRVLRVVDRIFKTKTGDRLLGRYLDSNKINDYLDKKAREMNNSHLWNTLNGREMDAYDSLSNGLRATKIIEGNGKVIVIDAPELMNKHHWALGFTLRSPPEKGGVTHFYVQRAAIEWLADRKNVKSDEEFKALIKLWVEHEQKEKSLISEGFNLRSAHLRTLYESDPEGKLQNFANSVVKTHHQIRQDAGQRGAVGLSQSSNLNLPNLGLTVYVNKMVLAYQAIMRGITLGLSGLGYKGFYRRELAREFNGTVGRRGKFEALFKDGADERGGWVNRVKEVLLSNWPEEIEADADVLRDKGVKAIGFLGMGGESSIIGPSGDNKVNISSTAPRKFKRLFGNYNLSEMRWFVVSKSGSTKETSKNADYLEKQYRNLGLNPVDYVTYVTDPGTALETKKTREGFVIKHRELDHQTSVGGRNTLANYQSLLAYAWGNHGQLRAMLATVRAAHSYKNAAKNPYINAAFELTSLLKEGRPRVGIIQPEWMRKSQWVWEQQNPEESLGKDNGGFTVYTTLPDIEHLRRGKENERSVLVEFRVKGHEGETQTYAETAKKAGYRVITIPVSESDTRFATEVVKYGWMELVAFVGALWSKKGTNISNQEPVESYKKLMREKTLRLDNAIDGAKDAVISDERVTLVYDGLLDFLPEEQKEVIKTMKSNGASPEDIYAKLLGFTRTRAIQAHGPVLDAQTLAYYDDVDESAESWLDGLIRTVFYPKGRTAKWGEGTGVLHGLFVNWYSGQLHQIPIQIVATDHEQPESPYDSHDEGAQVLIEGAVAAHMSLVQAHRPSVMLIVKGKLDETGRETVQKFFEEVTAPSTEKQITVQQAFANYFTSVFAGTAQHIRLSLNNAQKTSTVLAGVLLVAGAVTSLVYGFHPEVLNNFSWANLASFFKNPQQVFTLFSTVGLGIGFAVLKFSDIWTTIKEYGEGEAAYKVIDANKGAEYYRDLVDKLQKAGNLGNEKVYKVYLESLGILLSEVIRSAKGMLEPALTGYQEEINEFTQLVSLAAVIYVELGILHGNLKIEGKYDDFVEGIEENLMRQILDQVDETDIELWLQENTPEVVSNISRQKGSEDLRNGTELNGIIKEMFIEDGEIKRQLQEFINTVASFIDKQDYDGFDYYDFYAINKGNYGIKVIMVVDKEFNVSHLKIQISRIDGAEFNPAEIGVINSYSFQVVAEGFKAGEVTVSVLKRLRESRYKDDSNAMVISFQSTWPQGRHTAYEPGNNEITNIPPSQPQQVIQLKMVFSRKAGEVADVRETGELPASSGEQLVVESPAQSSKLVPEVQTYKATPEDVRTGKTLGNVLGYRRFKSMIDSGTTVILNGNKIRESDFNKTKLGAGDLITIIPPIAGDSGRERSQQEDKNAGEFNEQLLELFDKFLKWHGKDNIPRHIHGEMLKAAAKTWRKTNGDKEKVWKTLNNKKKELGSVGDKPLYLLTAVGLLGLGVAALFANGMVDTGAFQSPQVFALLASVSMGAGSLIAASAFSKRTSGDEGEVAMLLEIKGAPYFDNVFDAVTWLIELREKYQDKATLGNLMDHLKLFSRIPKDKGSEWVTVANVVNNLLVNKTIIQRDITQLWGTLTDDKRRDAPNDPMTIGRKYFYERRISSLIFSYPELKEYAEGIASFMMNLFGKKAIIDAARETGDFPNIPPISDSAGNLNKESSKQQEPETRKPARLNDGAEIMVGRGVTIATKRPQHFKIDKGNAGLTLKAFLEKESVMYRVKRRDTVYVIQVGTPVKAIIGEKDVSLFKPVLALGDKVSIISPIAGGSDKNEEQPSSVKGLTPEIRELAGRVSRLAESLFGKEMFIDDVGLRQLMSQTNEAYKAAESEPDNQAKVRAATTLIKRTYNYLRRESNKQDRIYVKAEELDFAPGVPYRYLEDDAGRITIQNSLLLFGSLGLAALLFNNIVDFGQVWNMALNWKAWLLTPLTGGFIVMVTAIELHALFEASAALKNAATTLRESARKVESSFPILGKTMSSFAEALDFTANGLGLSARSEEESKHRKVYENSKTLQQAPTFKNLSEAINWLKGKVNVDKQLRELGFENSVNALRIGEKITRKEIESHSPVFIWTADTALEKENEIREDIVIIWNLLTAEERKDVLAKRVSIFNEEYMSKYKGDRTFVAPYLWRIIPNEVGKVITHAMDIYGWDLIEKLARETNDLPAQSDSGALWDIGIGDEDAREVPKAKLAQWTHTANLMVQKTENISPRDINGELVRTMWLVDPEMPQGMSAYNFRVHSPKVKEGVLVIVTKKYFEEGTVIEESAYHELLEDYWMRIKGLDARSANILAAADQRLAFGQTGITKFDSEQITSMSLDKLKRIYAEDSSRRRPHHDLIGKHFGSYKLKRVQAYEERFRAAIIERIKKLTTPIAGGSDKYSGPVRSTTKQPFLTQEERNVTGPREFIEALERWAEKLFVEGPAEPGAKEVSAEHWESKSTLPGAERWMLAGNARVEQAGGLIKLGVKIAKPEPEISETEIVKIVERVKPVLESAISDFERAARFSSVYEYDVQTIKTLLDYPERFVKILAKKYAGQKDTKPTETKPTQKEFQQWAKELHDAIFEKRFNDIPNVLLDGVRNYLPKLLGDELRLNNFINLVRNLPYDDGRQFTKLLVGHIYDESDLRTDVAIKSDSIQTGEFYIQMLFALLKFNPELVIKTLTNAAVGKEGLRFSSQMVASAALKKLATLSETMIDVLLDLFGHLGFSAIMDQTKKIKDKEPSIIPPITGGSAEEESKQDNTHAFDLNGLNRSIRTALVVVGVAVNMVVAGFFGLGDITVLGHPVVLTAISVIGFVAGGTLGKFLWMYPYTVRMEDYGLSVKSVPGPNGMNQAEWSYNGERIEDVIALRDHQRRAGLPKRFIDEIESKHEFFASHIVGMFALVPVIGMSLAKGLVKLEIASSPLATRNDGVMVTTPDGFGKLTTGKSGNYQTTAHQSLSGLRRLLAPPLTVMSEFFDNLAQRKRLKLKLTIEESENGMRVARISEVVLRPTRIASLSKLPASYAVKAANYISPEQLPRGRELQNIAEQEQEHVKALKKQLVELNETAKGSANTLKLAGQVHGFELGLAELGNIKDTTALQAKIKNELNDMLNAVPAKDSVEIKAKINAYKKGINQGYSESKWPVIANNRGDDMVEVGSFEFKDSEAKEHTNPQILNVDVTELASGDTKAVPEHVRVSVKKYQELLGKEHIKPMLVFVSRDTGMENWEENVKMSLVGIADNETLRNAHYISGDELVEAGLLYQIKLGKDEVYNRVKTTAYLKNLPNLLSITRFKATIATNSPYGWEKRDKAVVDEKLEELVESLDIWLFGAGYVINVTDSIGEDYKIQNAIDIGA